MSPVATIFMAKKKAEKPVRKTRADAERNRTRILQVARQAFERSGAEASSDEIARLAGVGPGTLYRHFHIAAKHLIAPALNSVTGGIEKAVSAEPRADSPGDRIFGEAG
jgi:transcriptional regulator GlxA family with amidase domain